MRRSSVCFSTLRGFVGLAVLIGAGSCASRPHPHLPTTGISWGSGDTVGLTPPFFDRDVEALCDPPVGWIAEPLKKNSMHTHQVWVSPTHHTAYGVIRFELPLPLGEDIALDGFISHMKSTEGSAELLSRTDDPNLPGLRIVAKGAKHTIRANFMVFGSIGWAYYAGSNNGSPVDEKEMAVAVRAREHTQVGTPSSAK